ncbi:hypothetical protein AZE42_03012, partial [Rhizopogon vesiculosus]
SRNASDDPFLSFCSQLLYWRCGNPINRPSSTWSHCYTSDRMSQLMTRKLNLSKQNGAASGHPLLQTSPNKERTTLSWHEIPEWQRDNEYIRTGYRRVQNCWSGCVASIYSYPHNETGKSPFL